MGLFALAINFIYRYNKFILTKLKYPFNLVKKIKIKIFLPPYKVYTQHQLFLLLNQLDILIYQNHTFLHHHYD